MEQNVFINKFIELGMTDYFENKSVNNFEKHIIECLCDIYGHDSIKKCYDNRNENDFKNLLLTYGMNQNIYDNFLRDTTKFEKFKSDREQNPALKSDIASTIESELITMFLFKCFIEEPSMEDLGHFENDLLNNFSIIKMHFNSSINPNKTREIWEKKKKILSSNVELFEIKPDYLDEFTYARFGVNINDVKKMDYNMVNELNSYIQLKLDEQKDTIPKDKKNRWSANTIVTSGNGFVDALLIVAIIAAEMSIGVIYLFLHM